MTTCHGQTADFLFVARCPIGTYYDSDEDDCLLCPEGKYSPSEGALQCQSCPDGTWTVGTRQENFTSCTGNCRDIKRTGRRRQRERQKKALGWIGKTTSLHVHHAFLTFLCRHCTTTGKFLISHFMKEVNKRRLDFLSLSEHENMCLFYCKVRRTRLDHERSEGGNTRRSRVFLPTSWVF